MSKVKVKRQSAFIDMTAMCDVGFLLLTFFILTSKFRPNEATQVDIPASRAQIPLPAKDIMLITVAPDGKIFFGVDDQNTRLSMLSKIAEKWNFKVTAAQQQRFLLTDQFGVPMAQLPQLLDLRPEEIAKFKQPGITATDSINELTDLIQFARLSNPGLRIAIKADKDAKYENVNKVIETLRERKINRFNLITTAKAGGAAE